jgi:hypothetical protein
VKRRQVKDQSRSVLLLPGFEPRIDQPVAVRRAQRVNHPPGASSRLSDGDVPVLAMLQAVIRQPVTTEATVWSLASPGLDFRWTKWHRGRFLFKYLGFPVSLSFHQCSMLVNCSITDAVHRILATDSV